MELKIFITMSILSLIIWMIYIVKNREESDKFINFIILSSFFTFTWIWVYIIFQNMVFLWIFFLFYIIFSILIFTNFKIFDNITIKKEFYSINLPKTTTSDWDILVKNNIKMAIKNIKKLKVELEKYYKTQLRIQLFFTLYSTILVSFFYIIYFNLKIWN